ncbi:hypothetical protein COOONC_13917 [Cooperia oncophora]
MHLSVTATFTSGFQTIKRVRRLSSESRAQPLKTQGKTLMSTSTITTTRLTMTETRENRHQTVQSIRTVIDVRKDATFSLMNACVLVVYVQSRNQRTERKKTRCRRLGNPFLHYHVEDHLMANDRRALPRLMDDKVFRGKKRDENRKGDRMEGAEREPEREQERQQEPEREQERQVEPPREHHDHRHAGHPEQGESTESAITCAAAGTAACHENGVCRYVLLLMCMKIFLWRSSYTFYF